MKKYETYKDSGIEWIGEIPSHWDSVKLKFRGESIIGIIYSPDDVVNEGEGLLVLRSSNIQDGKLAFEDCVFVDKSVPDKHLTKEGDILLCARNGSAHLVGKAAYIDKQNEGVSFGAFMSIVRSDLDKYLYHFFSSQIFKAQTGLFSTSTINQLTSNTLNNMFISFPRDKTEQTDIAHYLDRKTAEIDELIAGKKRLLELYEEEKTGIINQAVTKGITSDVPMKNSGIEWLGEIPEDWEVKRFKHVSTKIGDGIHTTPSYLQGTEIYFINGVNLNNGEITLTDKTLSVPIEEYENYKIELNKGSILISLNGTIGKLAFYNNEKVILGKSAAYIELKDLVFNKFIYYLLKSQYINNYFEDSFSGTTIKNLSLYTLRNTPFPYMGLEEQRGIVKYIETECELIDAKKGKTEKLINLLSEYRTALISEVVTGKIKVTE